MTKRSTAAVPKKDEATGRWYFVLDVGVDEDGKRRQAKRRGFRTKDGGAGGARRAPRRRAHQLLRAADQTVSRGVPRFLAGEPADHRADPANDRQLQADSAVRDPPPGPQTRPDHGARSRRPLRRSCSSPASAAVRAVCSRRSVRLRPYHPLEGRSPTRSRKGNPGPQPGRERVSAFGQERPARGAGMLDTGRATGVPSSALTEDDQLGPLYRVAGMTGHAPWRGVRSAVE